MNFYQTINSSFIYFYPPIVAWGQINSLFFLLDFFISLRQVDVYNTADQVPKELIDCMTVETFHKARMYGLHKEQYRLIKALLLDVLAIFIELYFGVMASLWIWSMQLIDAFNLDTKNEILVSCVFMTLESIVNFFEILPFKLYYNFVLEEKHGFNKASLRMFAKGEIKLFIVTQVITTPVAAISIYIVQNGGDNFAILLWAFTAFVSLGLLALYPIIVAPIFDKHTPLKEGSLKKSIETLAAVLGFPATKIFVIEASKRSTHSNAYIYGFWNSKRIIIFDTMLLNYGKPKSRHPVEEEINLKGCTNEEVLAVMGHELGHWKLGHVNLNIIIMQTHLFIMYVVFGYIFDYAPVYEVIGFPPGTRPILVGLLIVFTYVMAPYGAIINFAMTILSRTFEYQADEFACKLGFGEHLEGALIKLNMDNLEFPIYDWLYSSWNHTHPTLIQRLKRLRKNQETNNKGLLKVYSRRAKKRN